MTCGRKSYGTKYSATEWFACAHITLEAILLVPIALTKAWAGVFGSVMALAGAILFVSRCMGPSNLVNSLLSYLVFLIFAIVALIADGISVFIFRRRGGADDDDVTQPQIDAHAAVIVIVAIVRLIACAMTQLAQADAKAAQPQPAARAPAQVIVGTVPTGNVMGARVIAQPGQAIPIGHPMPHGLAPVRPPPGMRGYPSGRAAQQAPGAAYSATYGAASSTHNAKARHEFRPMAAGPPTKTTGY